MSRTPKRWTEEEDLILRQEAIQQLDEGRIKDWHRIANKLPGRNNKDCRKRWCNKVTGGLKKGPWEEDEDSRLKNGVREFGYRWAVVAHGVGTRSADQCAKRWCHSLNPALDHSDWTNEEDQNLLKAVEIHGHGWKDIQTIHYPGRSANCVKNRYTNLTRKPEVQKPQDSPFSQSPNRSTPASFEGEEFLQTWMFEESEMTGLDFSSTSSTAMETSERALQPQPQRIDEDLRPNTQSVYSQSDFDLSSFPKVDVRQATSNQDSTSVDASFDFTGTWPADSPVDRRSLQVGFFPNDAPAGVGSLFPASPGPPTLSLTSTRTRSEVDRQESSVQVLSAKPSAVNDPKAQEPSTKGDSTDVNNESSKLILTIEDPAADTMIDIMGILAKSKTKMKLEMT